jgi:hypothetical protein
MSLAELRARGLSLSGGPKLRVVGPAAVVTAQRPLLEAQRDELLGALQDEAEDDIVSWPRAYRRWILQTIAFALSEGFSKPEAFWMAYRDIRAALEADRADVIAEAAKDGMLRAALDSRFVTVNQVVAGGAT